MEAPAQVADGLESLVRVCAFHLQKMATEPMKTIDDVRMELNFERDKLAQLRNHLMALHDEEATRMAHIAALELQEQRLMGIRPEG